MSTALAVSSDSQAVHYPPEWIGREEAGFKPRRASACIPAWRRWSVVTQRILEEALSYADFTDPSSYKCLHSESSADVTSSIEIVLMALSSTGIMIPHPAEVRDYLLRYPDMIDLLPSVCGIASERLAPDTQLSLEAYRDPEIEDEYLTLYARQRHYEQSLLDTIDEICAQYEDELAGRSGWILVTTDFRPPR